MLLSKKIFLILSVLYTYVIENFIKFFSIIIFRVFNIDKKQNVCLKKTTFKNNLSKVYILPFIYKTYLKFNKTEK